VQRYCCLEYAIEGYKKIMGKRGRGRGRKRLAVGIYIYIYVYDISSLRVKERRRRCNMKKGALTLTVCEIGFGKA
jgi:hypothetical protein